MSEQEAALHRVFAELDEANTDRHALRESAKAAGLAMGRAEARAERAEGALNTANQTTLRLLAQRDRLRAALADLMHDQPHCPHPPVPECCRYCFARAALEDSK